MNQRTILTTVAAAIALGLVVGAAPSILRSATNPAAPQLNAAAAAPALPAPLSLQQQRELLQGLLYGIEDRYADAIPILSKYAMLGEPDAQFQIGGMYYFGKGLPVDRDEGIRWLRLAAAQGLNGGQEALSAALQGTWKWDNSSEQSGLASSSGFSAVGQVATQPSATSSDYFPQQYSAPLQGASRSWAQDYISSPYSHPAPAPGPTTESYETSGSTMYADPTRDPPPNIGAINARTGDYMQPAGPGAYVDPRDGTFYAPAGPNQVVNTRTGDYSEVQH